MVGHSDFMSAYRTSIPQCRHERNRTYGQHRFYSTCAEVARVLPRRWFKRPTIPIPSNVHWLSRTSSIYTRLEQIEREHRLHLSFALSGLPPPIPDCGPAIVDTVQGRSPRSRPAICSRCRDCIRRQKQTTPETAYSMKREGVSLALEVARSTTRPVILVDGQ